ncbi:Sec-independent protein translocase protein TatB [Croceibacterium sp. TMG7-5b_MA50]|uniref:Sec-independent protein translocase protein TatB n=1 Tax=Croceibacterium sp. TMG7-5b_MA50 TaxID=3121290 RepID=UPI003221FEAD
MLDIGATELLLIVVVAVVVIGPKDLPLALRTAGKWIGQMRRLSNHFRAGFDAMIREAEMAEMEKKWREQNEKIMQAQSGSAGTGAESAVGTDAGTTQAVEAQPISDNAPRPELPAPSPAAAAVSPPPPPAPAPIEPPPTPEPAPAVADPAPQEQRA